VSQTDIEIIQLIQDKQRSFKITLGASMGMILIVYFFTFAMLVDKFPPAFFIFEAITSVIFLVSFFMLNKISFAYVKLRMAGKANYQDYFEIMQASDVDESAETILERKTESA